MIENKPYLTFIEIAGKNKHGQAYGRYLCSCGCIKVTLMDKVKKGLTISCGCYRKSIWSKMITDSITHGLSNHPLYKIYHNIIRRCYDPTVINYGRYGAKGVRVCDEWINSYKSFYEWAISNKWRKGLQIDKDINGNGLLYSPEMCCIVTPKENSNKQSTNVILEYRGIKYTVSQLAELYKINRKVLYDRITRQGLSVKEALTKKVRGGLRTNRSCEIAYSFGHVV